MLICFSKKQVLFFFFMLIPSALSPFSHRHHHLLPTPTHFPFSVEVTNRVLFDKFSRRYKGLRARSHALRNDDDDAQMDGVDSHGCKGR